MSNATVLKIGGSLLTQPDWPNRFYHWFEQQPPGLYLTIVGGGEVVEAMREIDRIHSLDQTELHWQCIDLLDVTFNVANELLLKLIPRIRTAQSTDELSEILRAKLMVSPSRNLETNQLVMVRVKAFYDRFNTLIPIMINHPPAPLPEIGWQTTSDTLAMYLACLIDAKRCVVFKSCEVDQISKIEDAVNTGIVDAQITKYLTNDIRFELFRL